MLRWSGRSVAAEAFLGDPRVPLRGAVMPDRADHPIPIEQTVGGLAFAVVAGVSGVWLAVAPADDFRPADAVIPVLIGIGVGLVIAAVAYFFFFVRQATFSRSQWVPFPLVGALALLFLTAPPPLRVGVSAGGAIILIVLMIAAAIRSRHGRDEASSG